ncbi:MAG: phosphatidate cytidylyltransferase [Bacteroidetes bacterium]|nr:phosphatidate cytidylyltransferase [Bacteroidota bacterium]MCL2303400.1 phosphatidate cytidylyltransferase [Lentimicrobiaceae bacterium]
MKTLITRTITGIAYLGIMAFAFFYSKYALIAIFTVFLFIAIFEYIHLAQKFPPAKNTMQRIMQRQILPIIWIIMPVALLIYWCIVLNAINIMVALFIILCMNDSLAYVFGISFGKHKLWPKVSPKKSWEGFFGGLICTMAAAWFLIHIPYFQNDVFINPYLWMGFTFVVIIAGTFGDLAESMVKRFANQKDSGAILPGHGGVLDRIDSVLFAVPAGFIYWVIASIR